MIVKNEFEKRDEELNRYKVMYEYYTFNPDRIMENREYLEKIKNNIKEIGKKHLSLENSAQELYESFLQKIKVAELIHLRKEKGISDRTYKNLSRINYFEVNV